MRDYKKKSLIEKTAVIFLWSGINHKGIKVSGERKAINASLLRVHLRREGIKTYSIRKKSQPLFKAKITAMEIAQFSRQLTIMLEAGIPIVQALGLIAKGNDNASTYNLIEQIRIDVEHGSSLAKSLQKHPKYFDELFVGLVTAGEQAGTLEHMLHELANYQEKTQALKAKVKQAMLYPILVMFATGIIFSLMLIFVIPQFKLIFTNFDAQLPPFTLLLIDLSEWLQTAWWKLLLSILGLSYLFLWAKERFIKLKRLLNRILFKLPIIGKIVKLSAIARFSRTLSIMFAAGVPLVEAMESVAGSTGNILYKETTLKIKQDIAQGVQLFSAMQNTQIFPNMVIQMTKIGEESGRIEEMLERIANYYEEQVDNLSASLVKQIEPFIMLVIGSLVGAFVIAMYLPIFKLGEVI
jgi:type IV pilus assembly protein PilC